MTWITDSNLARVAWMDKVPVVARNRYQVPGWIRISLSNFLNFWSFLPSKVTCLKNFYNQDLSRKKNIFMEAGSREEDGLGYVLRLSMERSSRKWTILKRMLFVSHLLQLIVPLLLPHKHRKAFWNAKNELANALRCRMRCVLLHQDLEGQGMCEFRR